MKTFQLLIDLRAVALAFFFAMFALPQAAHAQGSGTFVFEGFHFDAAEKARINQANDLLQNGVNALKRNDWATAQRDCTRAYGIFNNVGLPNQGMGKEAYQWALACIADSHAGRGNWSEACDRYREIGYYSLRIGNPRQMCAQQGSAEGSSLSTHSEYAASYRIFTERVTRLTALPEGSARTALAQELTGDCTRLRTFRQQVPPALAAAGYCSGIVAFEQGNSANACRTMWTSAGWIRIALQKQMLAEQRSHGERLQSTLDTYRPICADLGYAWPEFGGLWPH